MIVGVCGNCDKDFRKRERKRKFCSLFCANSFNKNGLIQVKLPKYSRHLAEFVGICLGDGYVSKYQTAITLNISADKDYISYVVSITQLLFPNIKISLINKQKENCIDIRLNSSIVANFFRDMGIIPKNKIVPTWILSSIEYKKFCVRGLVDTEGSISQKEYWSKAKGKRVYYQLNFRNYDKGIMQFVRDTLCELHLKPTMTLKKSLYLSNPRDIKIFQEEIGFSNPKFQLKLQSFSGN
jgi:hypothetical protein